MTKSIEGESSVELEEAAYLVRSRGRGRVRVRVRNGRLGLGQGESSVELEEAAYSMHVPSVQPWWA